MEKMEYGLIGEKLGHSYSPRIHAMLGDYRYELREIPRTELESFIRSRCFRGLNVTIPYKRDVLPLCDELTDAAREAGCVNTLVVQKDGKLWGHNTDIGGFICMLQGAGISPEGKKAVILGSGGTSHTARTALRQLGAGEIVVVSRSGPVTYDTLYRDHSDAQVLVNTTPVGMYPNNGACAVELERLPSLEAVVDVIYNPEKTELILWAGSKGLKYVSGLPMLVAQARLAAEAFTGRSIDPAADTEILRTLLSETLNLILTGMPGSGKSTLGRALATAMHRPFYDCDALIVERAGLSIPEIFARFGQEHFRELESQVLREVTCLNGAVISTGGGAIMRPENIKAMRQNSRVCHITRPLCQLSREGRPNSASQEAVAKLWEERKSLYEKASDFTVDNTADIISATKAIQEGFYEAAHH